MLPNIFAILIMQFWCNRYVAM